MIGFLRPLNCSEKAARNFISSPELSHTSFLVHLAWMLAVRWEKKDEREYKGSIPFLQTKNI